MGRKYIIELEDDPFKQYTDVDEPLYRVKGFRSLVFDEVGVSKLEPYIDRDIERIKKEAYDDGYKAAERKCVEQLVQINKAQKADMEANKEQAYQRGLSDAWKTAKEIIGMSWELKKFIFGDYHLLSNIFADFDPLEAMMKLKVTENGKNPIRFGDEVTFSDGKKAFFVVEDDEHNTGGFVFTDGTFVERDIKDVRGKTGDSLLSHLDTIINILCEGKI